MSGFHLRARVSAILFTLFLLGAPALPGQNQSLTPAGPSSQFLQRPTIGEPPASKASLKTPPFEIHMCIAHCFLIQWKDGHYVNVGQKNSSTYTVESFTRESVIMHRRDVGGFPLTATLTGRVSPDGNSIVDGKIVWTSGNHGEGPFRAAWGTEAQSAEWKAIEAKQLAADQAQAQAQAQARASAQTTQNMFGLLALLAGADKSEGSSGDITERISDLQDRFSRARDECGAAKSRYGYSAGNASSSCVAQDQLEDKLADANAALRNEIDSLEKIQPKLASECKAQNQQSCTQLQVVKDRLNKDRDFRARSVFSSLF